MRETDHVRTRTDPDCFEPDRWTPENEAKIPRYAYLPSGAGPHVCIGNHFAMLEVLLVLATLVQRVTFALVPGQQIAPEPLITLRPKGVLSIHHCCDQLTLMIT